MKPPVISEFPQRPSHFPLWLALVANILNALLTVQFYWTPTGAHIRPMAWAYWVFCISAIGFIAIPLGRPMFRQHPRHAVTWLTAILALSPFPLAIAKMRHAAWLRGFSFAP